MNKTEYEKSNTDLVLKLIGGIFLLYGIFRLLHDFEQ
jgi:hypothetical protein